MKRMSERERENVAFLAYALRWAGVGEDDIAVRLNIPRHEVNEMVALGAEIDASANAAKVSPPASPESEAAPPS